MQFYDILCQRTSAERQQLFNVPVIGDALRGDIDRGQYVAFLTQAFHHVKHTVPLMMACGSRLGEEYGWLRRAVADYVEEEIGHEEWILSDIAACGADPERARRSRPDPATELMVAYAYHQIDRGNPVAFLGMVHVLEGTSTALATQAAGTIRQVLGLPQEAFSYLTSHGSLDLEHVAFFEGLVNRLEREGDRDAVIHCARMMYRLYGDIFRGLPQCADAFGEA
ncbi:TenA family transcriptional regulator [Telluria beijingensis]|uniref:TenA family transcriptional regulator n=1 Tax=Telluria beijingensis TaxID=3068633 RepID=UPI002795D371|nr:iron-containing redox enzyme family protein [Massilia sp. REN29]